MVQPSQSIVLSKKTYLKDWKILSSHYLYSSAPVVKALRKSLFTNNLSISVCLELACFAVVNDVSRRLLQRSSTFIQLVKKNNWFSDVTVQYYDYLETLNFASRKRFHSYHLRLKKLVDLNVVPISVGGRYRSREEVLFMIRIKPLLLVLT